MGRFINDFEIDIFNQYELEENAKTSTCPLCSASRKNNTQKCLMLDWSRGLGTCQHCGEVIQLHTFKSKKTEKKYNKPVIKTTDLFKIDLSENVIKWFKNRHISKHTLQKMKITEGKEFMPQLNRKLNTIQFNYYRNNELINIKYRDGAKNFKLFKGAERIMYNLDLCAISDEVVIVEGEMDVLAYVESGILFCSSIPNGSTLKNVNLDYLDNSIEYFENKKKIYLALDNDAPGQNVQKELIRRLGAERCYLVNFADCKDANEFLIKYGTKKLNNTIENAKPVPLENVKTANNVREELREFYLKGDKRGFITGLGQFDNIFSVLTKMFILITGIPTSGKTEFVNQLACGWAVNHKLKGAFVSVESKPSRNLFDNILQKISGIKPEIAEDFESEQFQNAIDFVNDYFFDIDFEKGYDLEKVLSKVKELIIRKGIKYFVLDPYNKIRYKGEVLSITGNRINDYTSTYLNILNDFCVENGVFAVLVAHPTKIYKENGVIPMPTFYDVKGGGEFYDMSPLGLVVHRHNENKTVEVKVLKVKFKHLGSNYSSAFFGYNTANGRYSEIVNYNQFINGAEPIFNHTNKSMLESEINTFTSKIAPSVDFDSVNDPMPF